MLHEIYCEQFHQKRIVFNPGLSVVLGTNAGDNSIGKSTFLLIVDYVFGGSTYAGTTDIIENVGSHDIYFSFIFGEEIFKFCRNSINAHTVWKCNDSYEKVEEIGLNDYCKWLDSKYAISLPELSFRDAVGRYIRVYGKNNCDERHPLHYQATEKAEKACTALLKLFDAYTPLKETEAAAQRSDAELTAYKKAQALQFIAKITKRVHDKNEKEIRSIAAQIEELSSGLERGLLDVDAAASEQAVYIKKLLSRARRARSKVKARWDLLDENGNYAFSPPAEEVGTGQSPRSVPRRRNLSFSKREFSALTRTSAALRRFVEKAVIPPGQASTAHHPLPGRTHCSRCCCPAPCPAPA